MKIPRYTMAYTVYETDRNDEAGEWCKWEDVKAALDEQKADAEDASAEAEDAIRRAFWH